MHYKITAMLYVKCEVYDYTDIFTIENKLSAMCEFCIVYVHKKQILRFNVDWITSPCLTLK